MACQRQILKLICLLRQRRKCFIRLTPERGPEVPFDVCRVDETALSAAPQAGHTRPGRWTAGTGQASSLGS